MIDFDRTRGWSVAGTDECGRGCLAGPIVAAGVRFDYDTLSAADLEALTALNDSKKLSGKRRGELFSDICRIASAVSVVSRSAGYIDRYQLHKTNLHCLGTALALVERPGTFLLSDGYMPSGLDHPCEAVVKGDATSAAIAAASIVAKVSRDRFMQSIAATYPEYSFERHVGYATPIHRAAIVAHGPTPIHRMSFASDAYEQFQLVA